MTSLGCVGVVFFLPACFFGMATGSVSSEASCWMDVRVDFILRRGGGDVCSVDGDGSSAVARARVRAMLTMAGEYVGFHERVEDNKS